MFTGIVTQTTIAAVRLRHDAMRLTLYAPFTDLQLGESIAVDGMCVTVTDISAGLFGCDLSPETLSKTIARQYQAGDFANIERALSVGDRLGGHWVTGHVDRCLTVSDIQTHHHFHAYTFSGFTAQEAAFLIEKGSVTVNGVSLTLNAVTPDTFSVMLIPETLRSTNLSRLKISDPVNIEFDYLAKIAAKQLSQYTHCSV